MAVYHLSAKVISRSAGRSAVAAAAYRSGDRLTAERYGIEHDYSRRHGIEHSEILAPDDAPEWMRDREQLWNGVEAVEKRKDAQLAREVEISLPRELSHDQRVELVRGFVQSEFVDRGMVADVAIHCPTASDGLEQPHAHVMLTTREIIPNEGFGGKNRDWNRSEALDGWRERWADHQNRALERAGHEQRVDHRSLEAQRGEALEIANDNARGEPERQDARSRAEALDREPQPKLGVSAAAMERRGIETDRGDLVRQATERNAERMTLREQVREIGSRAVDLGREIAEKARDAWDRLDLSQGAKALERAVWDGLRLPSADAALGPRTPYAKALDAFHRSVARVEPLRKDGLVLPYDIEKRHKQCCQEYREELKKLAKDNPEKVWDVAKRFESKYKIDGKDLKKEIALTLDIDKKIMRSLERRSPRIAMEISDSVERKIAHVIGFRM